jgi:hypothetical protein
MKALVVAAFAVWIACGAIRWVASPPLAHDEAHYALAARDRLAGDPPRWVYVSIGAEAIAMPGILAGGSERALRVLPMLLGLAFLFAAWRAAAVLGDETSAAWTVAVLAGTTPLTRFQIDLMSDLPSAACLLGTIAILVDELRRPGGPRWRIVAAAPLAAAALYIRYGSCVPLAMIAVATLAFARIDRKLVVTGVAFAALVVRPSVVRTLLVSSTVPPRGGGVSGYAAHPLAYFGALATCLFVLAVAFGWRERWRLYATVLGVADIVVLGIETHAHTRYVALGIALLVAAGCAAACDLVRKRRALIAGALIAVTASWIGALHAAFTARAHRIAGMRGTLAAAAAIDRDAAGRRCTVIGRHSTQLEWYSGCRAAYEPDGLTYVVRDDTGGPDQPELSAYTGTPLLHTQNVDVIRVSAPASAGRADPSTSRGR